MKPRYDKPLSHDLVFHYPPLVTHPGSHAESHHIEAVCSGYLRRLQCT